MPEHQIDITSVTLETIISMNGSEFTPEAIRDIDSGTKGIYIFYQISPLRQVWYVGASQNLKGRFKSHTFKSLFRLLSKAGCSIKFVTIEYPEQEKEELIAIESVFIRRLNPILNLQHNQLFKQFTTNIKEYPKRLDFPTQERVGHARTESFDPSKRETGEKIASSILEEASQMSESFSEDDIFEILSNSKIRALKKVASYCNIIGYSNMTKYELAIAIKESGKLMETKSLQVTPTAF